jgi:hypothetical protein
MEKAGLVAMTARAKPWIAAISSKQERVYKLLCRTEFPGGFSDPMS